MDVDRVRAFLVTEEEGLLKLYEAVQQRLQALQVEQNVRQHLHARNVVLYSWGKQEALSQKFPFLVSDEADGFEEVEGAHCDGMRLDPREAGEAVDVVMEREMTAEAAQDGSTPKNSDAYPVIKESEAPREVANTAGQSQEIEQKDSSVSQSQTRAK